MSFDGLVTDEEVAAYFPATFFTEEAFEEANYFVHFEVCRRFEKALRIKGARTVLNKSAIFQYVCRQKGCLLGALVPIRGKNYWIHQRYVTYFTDVETGIISDDGYPQFEKIPSVPDYVSHSSRPQLERDAGFHAVSENRTGAEDCIISCRHTSVVASDRFKEEKRKARTKKHRALYI